MPTHALAVVAALFCGPQVPPYTVEAPDILSVEVGGLPKRFAPVGGDRLVRPDGTINLGQFGSVSVAGQTVPQIERSVTDCLRQAVSPRRADRLTVRVSLRACNSKFYYVVTDLPGSGESVIRLPLTGRETVLDAISTVGGLAGPPDKRVWVARPAPGGGDQILPVDWVGLVGRADRKANIPVLHGDRVFVMSR